MLYLPVSVILIFRPICHSSTSGVLVPGLAGTGSAYSNPGVCRVHSGHPQMSSGMWPSNCPCTCGFMYVHFSLTYQYYLYFLTMHRLQ